MMLSRVADSLYWMSRYLERAEHTARMIDVHLNLMLDQPADATDLRWRRVLSTLGQVSEGTEAEAYRAVQAMAFDTANRSSIVSCIIGARENARQVRELISSDMWEQLNRLFHEVKRSGIEDVWESQPLEFLQAIKQGIYLFQGITNSTLAHGEGWQFIRAGRYVERAYATAILLDVHFKEFAPGIEKPLASEHLEWVGLLRSCTAFAAYCHVYTADLRPDRIVEFLLLNEEFPHSICFAVNSLQDALESIADITTIRRGARVSKLAGRLRATLSFGQIDEIMAGGLHAYLGDVMHQCDQIHASIHHVYISYAVEAALA